MDRVALGKRIQFFRVLAGLSRKELADLVGVTQGAVGLWERGVASPALESIYAMVDSLGITMQVFWGTILGVDGGSNKDR